METKKLFAFDLDGTLFNDERQISERTINIIDSLIQKGNVISIATARPVRDVLRLLPQNFSPHYVVCYNGAEVYNRTSLIVQSHIPPETAYQVIKELALRQAGVFIGVESLDVFHVNQSPAHLFGEVDHSLTTFNDFNHHVFKNGITKIIFEGSHHNLESYTKGLLNDICSVTHTDNGAIIQVMAQGVDKWEALKSIAQIEGIAIADVIAFGNDHNDISMITSCGVGVAMANSTPALLALARYTTTSNENEGVAVYLEKYFN
jgi:Cof subfamily protein (haloacid dehalogenase superfamily)